MLTLLLFAVRHSARGVRAFTACCHNASRAVARFTIRGARRRYVHRHRLGAQSGLKQCRRGRRLAIAWGASGAGNVLFGVADPMTAIAVVSRVAAIGLIAAVAPRGAPPAQPG
jgi:hypothetical protein